MTALSTILHLKPILDYYITLATYLLTGEKGERNHMESSAEYRKISFPLLITIKV